MWRKGLNCKGKQHGLLHNTMNKFMTEIALRQKDYDYLHEIVM